MILPDVNTLVYAYRAESAQHPEYAAWVNDIANGSDDLALVDEVLISFVRIVSNPRIYDEPAPTADALGFVDALRRAHRAHRLTETDATWRRLEHLVGADHAVRGNLVPDAWLASLAIAHGCRLATADRGMARFEGLNWFIPVTPIR
jgi:uncharacterized protein